MKKRMGKEEREQERSLSHFKSFSNKVFCCGKNWIHQEKYFPRFFLLSMSLCSPPLLVTLFCRKVQGIEEYEKSKETSQISTIAPFTTLPLILDSFSHDISFISSPSIPQLYSSSDWRPNILPSLYLHRTEWLRSFPETRCDHNFIIAIIIFSFSLQVLSLSSLLPFLLTI